VKSLVSKRSVVIAGHKTSLSLEDAFWNSLIKFCGSAYLAQLAAIGHQPSPQVRRRSA
jgi:predicted DNA-binding ribbon-helix-helix protein